MKAAASGGRAVPLLAARALVLLALALACGRSAVAAERAPGQRTQAAPAPSEPLYVSGLKGEWQDYGWAPRELKAGAPARLDLSNKGGWIIARPGYGARPAGLVLRYRAPRGFGDFLEVRLDGSGSADFPHVRVLPRHRLDGKDGWSEAWLSLQELNPAGAPFDRIVLRAAEQVGNERVEVDGVGFTATAPAGGPEVAAAPQAAPREVQLSLDCRAPAQRIKPGIYGIAYDQMRDAQSIHQWQLGATMRRWGGNATSRYNWELGNAWNTASDWYFRNVNYTDVPNFSYTRFLDADLEKGVQTALTVPTIGWVAKDTSSHAFSVATFGAQASVDPSVPDAGNGVDTKGQRIAPGPPELTSVPAGPDFIGRWVKAIRKRDAEKGTRSVHMYILDNEPALWSETHRDVHPEPVTYDELLQRTLAYGTAVRRADPDAVIAGPAEWGWSNYLYSAKDAKVSYTLAPDRRAHGNVPLVPWLLRKVRESERQTGVRVLDVLDLHFYPQGKGIGVGTGGQTDPGTNERRIRSTRGLWDPTYVDESWIGEPVRLIPRMREWVDQNAPGVGLSIGEYNFGAEGHMSGGLALAEALGRFGQYGLDAAFYWTYPPENSPAFWAFRAYRNFDGKGGRFQDLSVPARSSLASTSLFASRDESGEHLVAVLLNLDPERPARGRLDLGACGSVSAQRAFRYIGEAAGFRELPASEVPGASGPDVTLPPYSMTVLDLTLSARPKTSR
ncbi:glycosyl hydrolase [Aggregicoccus sp. 17bor-14]|uniref:glycoside hydrolase family 44 protein n=1 Tax=Myxococcaceae TaxID=31 RepID=UPI00129D0039|nr:MULTISPECIES: glycoside hydrolase family 44 protein [Myxococcaceae]MBF5042601.1 glycoside hydrolase family 44 protein [Simulacricoccus sp. 17bor-14]MRI88369.1 glycosyl hydrolase [Aggregicoccus sp. 17bor-14]